MTEPAWADGAGCQSGCQNFSPILSQIRGWTRCQNRYRTRCPIRGWTRCRAGDLRGLPVPGEHRSPRPRSTNRSQPLFYGQSML